MRMFRGVAGRRRLGYVLIAFTLSLFLMLGCIGLSVDIGRMYITRNESQSFCDAAALAGARELDGTSEGITRARNAALAIPKAYNFGSTLFDPSQITIEFAQDPPTTWDPIPATPADYWITRVSTSVPLGMWFMPALTRTPNANIGASASAKKIPNLWGLDSFFPFAPYWEPGPAVNCGTDPCDSYGTVPTGSTAPDPPDPFGMIPARLGTSGSYTYQPGGGGVYTLRGPGNIKYDHDGNVDPTSMCPNDATNDAARYRDYNGQPDRGFVSWDTGSAANLRDAIIYNDPLAPDGETLSVGEQTPPASSGGSGGGSGGGTLDPGCTEWCLMNGTKETEVRAIQDRIGMDTNTTSMYYKDYVNNGGNDERVVVVPIVTGLCGTGGTLADGSPVPQCPLYPSDAPGGLAGTRSSANVVLGFAQFFLLPVSSYPMGATNPICAEYVGPWVPNTSGGPGGSNPYHVVLVQ